MQGDDNPSQHALPYYNECLQLVYLISHVNHHRRMRECGRNSPGIDFKFYYIYLRINLLEAGTLPLEHPLLKANIVSYLWAINLRKNQKCLKVSL